MKFSKFISFFFHPINFSIIGAIIYFIFVPKYIYKPQEYLLLTIVFIGTYLIPLILVFLMKRARIISSYDMKTVEERKFPLLVLMAISLFIAKWLFQSALINMLAISYFGYGVCLIVIYILLHLKLKVSLHMAAIGSLIGFLIYFSYFYKINLIYILATLFFLAGIIASARLKLNAHTFTEVLVGFILGIVSQLIVYAVYIYNI